MPKQSTKAASLWINIGHLSLPQSSWVWWVLEGDPKSPGGKSRSYERRSTLQLELESRGYRAPTSSEIEEAIIQARVEGKDDAFIEVPPPQKT
jgi:hypothetical protein